MKNLASLLSFFVIKLFDDEWCATYDAIQYQFSTLEKKYHASIRIIVGFLSKFLRHLRTDDYSALLSFVHPNDFLGNHILYIGLSNLR
jgi:hypothetical protein